MNRIGRIKMSAPESGAGSKLLGEVVGGKRGMKNGHERVWSRGRLKLENRSGSVAWQFCFIPLTVIFIGGRFIPCHPSLWVAYVLAAIYFHLSLLFVVLQLLFVHYDFNNFFNFVFLRQTVRKTYSSIPAGMDSLGEMTNMTLIVLASIFPAPTATQ